MPEQLALTLADLPPNTKKTVTLGETKVLIVRTGDRANGEPTLFAVEAECPHAKAPLEKGAVCNGRLVCPWHTGTFVLETGALVEPPPLRDLKRYPLRLGGQEIFVDPTPLPIEPPAKAGEDKHLVFAGGGAATAAALCYLRDQGFAGKLTVIEPEGDEPVDRTQLSKNSLAGKVPLETLPLLHLPSDTTEPPPPGFERIGAAVTQLNREEKSIALTNGATLSYDALLLATGGVPRQLKVPGSELPNVFTIRHTADLRRMEPYFGEGKRAVLIGDSFIALEAASALRQRGLHVTVVARSGLPFAKKFGDVVAESLMQLHRSHGVNLHTDAEVTSITPIAVALASGAEIPADLVIVAIGVKPVIGYATDLPHGERGGFAVGRNLRLAPNLWAAGDIASVDGTRIEHWRVAEQHGRTAAEAMYAYATGNAHGPSYPFAGVPFFWTFHFGKRLSYAGHADRWDTIAYDGDPAKLDFLAFYVKDGAVAAVLGCGRDTAIASLMEPLRESLTLDEAKAITAAAAA
ncbi:MAG: FAD-dependent oxidoreductase [Janthinobacterium lividum]